MPKRITEQHNVAASFSPNGVIILQLGPKPYTITRMVLVLKLNVSTGATVSTYNDPWDRVITNLSLTSGGYSYFAFSDMRLARHLYRMSGKQFRTPAGLAASQTNVNVTVAYNIHFGVSPTKIDATKLNVVDNPYDLTAGVPPNDSSLVLSGQWGSASAPGTGYTINSGSLIVVLFGVQPDAGDPVQAYMPMARPRFFSDMADASSTSSIWAKIYNVPVGDYLYASLILTSTGALGSDSRSSNVLNSLQVMASRPTLTFISATDDDVIGIIGQVSERGEAGWPPADDPAAPGSFTLGKTFDEGPLRGVGHREHPDPAPEIPAVRLIEEGADASGRARGRARGGREGAPPGSPPALPLGPPGG